MKGASDSASTDLLASWLAVRLRCPVRRVSGPKGQGLMRVELQRASGPIVIDRPGQEQATLTQPGQRPRQFPLPRLSTAEALAEELRWLDKDEVYHSALRGLEQLRRTKQ